MESYFLTMIQNARINEEVIIYGNTLDIDEKEMDETVKFLYSEYVNEATSYPYIYPSFHEEAALWGAQLFFIASQLLLHRKNRPEELITLIPAYKGKFSAGAILSADLTLRFVPDILFNLKKIDTEDDLIPLLEKIMEKWHYSGIRYLTGLQDPDFNVINNNFCLKHLYVDRIIECKNTALACHPSMIDEVLAVLGIFEDEFWTNFLKVNQKINGD